MGKNATTRITSRGMRKENMAFAAPMRKVGLACHTPDPMLKVVYFPDGWTLT